MRTDKEHGHEYSFDAESGRFVQTLEAMLDLTDAGCAIPAVRKVDWNTRTIACSAVQGPLLRQVIDQSSGAARKVLLATVGDLLLQIHESGYVIGCIDQTSVNVINGAPVFTNMTQVMSLSGLSRDVSVYARDIDRLQLNASFGTALLTAATMRGQMAGRAPATYGSVDKPGAVYAPVLIRDDVHWGKLWNPDVGVGRWNYIMQEHLPVPRGGSVLDLGSNNGYNPLQMLRAGAASAVGVEIDENCIRESEVVKSAYEWLDNRRYDFHSIHGSHAELARLNLPRFDMVTALCTLYYLSDAEMREAVRCIRSLTDLLVLQCNTDRLIDRSSEDTYRKASVEFAVEVLEASGFRSRVIAPPGYSRPLVIGRTS
ncbi:class I SAM-dependent methyltransferase [Sphingomonas sp. F9_3S_D5_B_2]